MEFLVYVNSRQDYGVFWPSHLSVLCIGVKWITVSALTLYWSRVHRVLSSHLFWLGHQIAWSDQSIAMSGQNKIMLTMNNHKVSECVKVKGWQFYQHHYSHSQEDDIRIMKLNENVWKWHRSCLFSLFRPLTLLPAHIVISYGMSLVLLFNLWSQGRVSIALA